MASKGQRPFFSLSDRILSATARALILGSTMLAVPAFFSMQKTGDGSGSNDGGDGDQGGSTSSDDDDDDDDDSGSTDDKDDKDDSGSTDSSQRSSSGQQTTVSKEEYDKLVNRMKAADKRSSELEAKVKEFERAEQSELEQAQSDLQESQKTTESLQDQVVDLQAENAFLKNDKHKFKNQKAALKLARDYFDDHADDDGNIDMDAVVEKVAKDYPELLQQKEEGDSPSGAPLRGGSRNNSGRVDKQTLRKKYSALRR